MKPLPLDAMTLEAVMNTMPGVWPPSPIGRGRPFKGQHRLLVGDAASTGPYRWDSSGLVCTVRHRLNRHTACLAPPYRPGDGLYIQEPVQIVERIDQGCGVILYPHDGRRRTLYADLRNHPVGWTGPTTEPLARPDVLYVRSVLPARLRDLTEEDAELEGVGAVNPRMNSTLPGRSFVAGYQVLWDQLHQSAFAWSAGNWLVWVLELERRLD